MSQKSLQICYKNRLKTMRVFWNSCTETFTKLSEKNMWWSSLLLELQEYSLQPTTGKHYRYILRVLRKERVFWIWKIPKKSLRKCAFCLTLQLYSPEFLTSANADFKKNVFFEKSEIVGSLPKKGLYWSHLINKTLLKNLFTHFWENVGKIAVMKGLENYQRKRL